MHAELGSLRYLADRTKPTRQFPISVLQSGAINPTQVQIDGVKHVIRYLTGSIHDGLTFARGLESEPLADPFDAPAKDGSLRRIIVLKGLPLELSKVQKLPADIVNKLAGKRIELDNEIFALEGAPIERRNFRCSTC